VLDHGVYVREALLILKYNKSYTQHAEIKIAGTWGSELLADIYASIATEYATPSGGEPTPSTFFKLFSRCPESRGY
jgi:hypothetical protein